jgi:uncharacterized protein YpmB
MKNKSLKPTVIVLIIAALITAGMLIYTNIQPQSNNQIQTQDLNTQGTENISATAEAGGLSE